LEADIDEPFGRDDFRIAVPVDQVVTMQFFDLDLYTRRFDALDTDDPDLSEALAEALDEETVRDEHGTSLPGQVSIVHEVPEATTGAIAPSQAAHSSDDPAFGLYASDSVLLIAQWSATVSIIGALLVAPLSWHLTIGYLLFATLALLALSLLPSGKLIEHLATIRAEKNITC
jgi:hypothetical protein